MESSKERVEVSLAMRCDLKGSLCVIGDSGRRLLYRRTTVGGKQMRSLTLCTLLIAGAFSLTAHAQAVQAEPDPRGEMVPILGAPGPEISETDLGIRALKLGEFARAEKIFAEIVRREHPNFAMTISSRSGPRPESWEANLYLGVARMGLAKWEEAKKPLEIAASENSHPDPTSRLGVTYAKLGNVAGAEAQRADLVRMREACKDNCELSPFILQGIRMIDEALAAP